MKHPRAAFTAPVAGHITGSRKLHGQMSRAVHPEIEPLTANRIKINARPVAGTDEAHFQCKNRRSQWKKKAVAFYWSMTKRCS